MPFSLLVSLFLFLAGATSQLAIAAPTTTIGVTYISSSNLPPPERVATALESLHISAVRLPDPSPAVVRAFSYSNISLLLSVPNRLVPSFAANISSAALWLYNIVVPFYPRAHISLISVGADFTSDSSSLSDVLLPAIQNLQLALRDVGIKNVAVSTTFSFINVMTTSFPPSSNMFKEPINELTIKPLLQFLDETNSSFLINLYPYNLLKLNSEIPVGFALFQQQPFNFRDDVLTGVRYLNLFDMMVDAVIAAMAVSGFENIPVIVTETGWPTSGDPNEAESYAELYLMGLISHLKSGLGTPLRKEGVVETYIYKLFDNSTKKTEQKWGILYPNMTTKYHIDFSASEKIINGGGCQILQKVMTFLLIVSVLLFQ